MSDSKKRPAPVDIAQQVAEARRRAQAINEARQRALAIAGKTNGTPTPPPPAENGVNGASPTPAPPSAAMSRLDAIKARVAAAAAKTATPAPASSATPPPRAPSSRPAPPPSSAYGGLGLEERPRTELSAGSRGGLSVGIHPSLLGDAQDKGKKDWKAKGKGREEGKAESTNPYLSEEKSSGGRARRTLNFTHNMHERPAMQAANEVGYPLPIHRHMLIIS